MVNPAAKASTVLINLTKATRKSKEMGNLAKAALICGIPLPEASGAKRSTKKPDNHPKEKPKTGKTKATGSTSDACIRQEPNQPILYLRKTADKPDTKPIKQASAIASLLRGSSHWRKCISYKLFVVRYLFHNNSLLPLSSHLSSFYLVETPAIIRF